MKTTSCPVTIDFLIRKGVINSDTGKHSLWLYISNCKKWHIKIFWYSSNVISLNLQSQIYRSCRSCCTFHCIKYIKRMKNEISFCLVFNLLSDHFVIVIDDVIEFMQYLFSYIVIMLSWIDDLSSSMTIKCFKSQCLVRNIEKVISMSVPRLP